jgi:hypothetical protein
MNHDFFIYNTERPTLFYLPHLPHIPLFKINKTGEITPIYDIKNCENLIDNLKTEKVIQKEDKSLDEAVSIKPGDLIFWDSKNKNYNFSV